MKRLEKIAKTFKNNEDNVINVVSNVVTIANKDVVIRVPIINGVVEDNNYSLSKFILTGVLTPSNESIINKSHIEFISNDNDKNYVFIKNAKVFLNMFNFSGDGNSYDVFRNVCLHNEHNAIVSTNGMILYYVDLQLDNILNSMILIPSSLKSLFSSFKFENIKVSEESITIDNDKFHAFYLNDIVIGIKSIKDYGTYPGFRNILPETYKFNFVVEDRKSLIDELKKHKKVNNVVSKFSFNKDNGHLLITTNQIHGDISYNSEHKCTYLFNEGFVCGLSSSNLLVALNAHKDTRDVIIEANTKKTTLLIDKNILLMPYDLDK